MKTAVILFVLMYALIIFLPKYRVWAALGIAALFLLLGMILPIFPVILGISVATRAYKSGKTRMEEEILPEMREKAGEAVRLRQRRRWERKHGAHEKSD